MRKLRVHLLVKAGPHGRRRIDQQASKLAQLLALAVFLALHVVTHGKRVSAIGLNAAQVGCAACRVVAHQSGEALRLLLLSRLPEGSLRIAVVVEHFQALHYRLPKYELRPCDKTLSPVPHALPRSYAPCAPACPLWP